MASAACFVSGGTAPGAALQALLEKEPLSLSAIDLVCCEQQTTQQHQQGPSSDIKYNVVLSASSSPHSRDALVRVARAMAPGGRLYVYEAAQTASSGPEPRLESLKKDLLLSGFTDAQVLDGTGLSASAAAVPAVWVFAQLPSWGLGAAAKLSLKRPAAVAAVAPAPPPTAPATTVSTTSASTWKLAVGGGEGEEEEEEELVDEDMLLTAEEKRAVPAPKPDDCEVGQSGRKACKNCSCGRAEAEAAAEGAGGTGTGVKLTADMMDNPQSACGNCYLGDAFRCSTCPYRGLPAFQPGEKITLGASLLAADV